LKAALDKSDHEALKCELTIAKQRGLDEILKKAIFAMINPPRFGGNLTKPESL
jgi:hypothetical protein